MAQHLSIQAKHHYQLKQHTQFITCHISAWRYVLKQKLAASRLPGGSHLTARRQPLQTPLMGLPPPGAPNPAARRRDSTVPLTDFTSLS